jgi:hypothetical protein
MVKSFVVSLGVVCLLAGVGCATARQNPERLACTSACNEAKNACMIQATTPGAVGACDADQRACLQPCLAMPRHLPR